MQTIIKIFIFFSITFIMVSAIQAQNNVAKLNLAGIAVGQIDLQYERVTAPKQSVHFTAGYMPGVEYASRLQAMITEAVPNEKIDISTASLSGFQFVPEYRFYTGAAALRGFYVAPQLCFSSYKLKAVGSNNNFFTNKATVDYTSLGAGAQIGLQWLIKDRVSIDWQIIGIGVSSVTANAVGEPSYLYYYGNVDGLDDWAKSANSYMQKDARLALVKFMDIKRDDKTLIGKGATISPYFRTGLAVGFSF